MSGDNLWIGDLPSDIDEATVKAVFEGYGAIVSTKLIMPKSQGRNAAALIRFENAEDAKWVVENLNGNMPEGFETPVVVQFAKNSPGGGGGGGGKGSDYGKAPSAGKGYHSGASPYAPPPPSYARIEDDAGGYGGPPSSKGAGKAGGKYQNASSGGFKGYLASLAKSGKIPGVGSRPDEHCVYIKNLPPDTTNENLYQLFSVFGALAHGGVTAMLKEDGACLGVGFVDFQDPISAATAVEVLNGTTMPDGTQLNLNIKRSRKGKGKGPGGTLGEELQLQEELPAMF